MQSIFSNCRFLKELNITTKKINNYIVCKDIDKIKSERVEYSCA